MKAAGYIVDDSSGKPELRAASLEEQVKDSLRAILLTRRGERALKPELGSDMHRFLFRPLSQSLLGEMKAEVKNALAVGEPRVRVQEVHVRASEDRPELLDLQIEFEVKQTRKPGQVRVQLHA